MTENSQVNHSDNSPTDASDDQKSALTGKLSFAFQHSVITFSLLTLVLLALLYSAYFAAGFLIPVTLSILFTLMLQPCVRLLSSLRFPPALSSALIVTSIVGTVIFGFYRLSVPAAEWLERTPEILGSAEAKFKPFREPLIKFQEVKDQVGEMTTAENEGAEPGENSGNESDGVETGIDWSKTLQASSSFLVNCIFVVMLVFLMLASQGRYSRKVVSLMPTFKDKRRAIELISEIQNCISQYLATISVINLGVGTATTVAMWLLGMPNPLLWGVLATTLNFVPYIGPLVTWLILSLVSFFSFDSMHQVLLPPLAFAVIAGIEGQLVTPVFTGRQLRVSPVANFIFLAFMGWLWGVVGMLIAIPLLASIKILCTQIDMLNPIAVFLGNDE